MLSVVISSLNSAETIGCTLHSLLSNDFPRDDYEIIVVDGGSTDNTVDVCRRFLVKPLFCQKKGWASALNLGISNAKGDIICITDSDVIVPNDWLRKIWEFFKSHPDIEGVGGPNLAPLYNKNDIQKFTGEIFVEDQGFPTKLTRSQYGKMWGGGLICGPNYAYRRETLLYSEGFNESLMSYTDVDLCWRLVKTGKRLMFNPEIKVVHLGFPLTISGVIKQQFKWGKGLGEIMKIHRVYNVTDNFKVELYSSFQILRAILLLFSPTCFLKTKQLLRCIHYVSFNLGRIYGR
jgi:cellulose synthase/poly-beta-1,6-N-acetylglucosamine synthase-like glycosyltransferase